MSNFERFGFYAPRETIKEMDRRKGKYLSRNKYLLKIIEEHWNEEDQLRENVVGPKVTSPIAQPPPLSPTSTHAGTLEVDSLRDMATTEGNRRGGVDVNDKDPNSSF